MKKEHILIIRFSALGDVAMTVPVVYSLAKTYPDLRITVLSRGIARTFFEDLAPNVNFMEADIKGEYKGVKGLNALYRRLTAKKFTAIADFHGVLRSGYLRLRFKFDRYKVAHINKHRSERKSLVSKSKKVLAQIPTSFANYAEVLAKLGYPIDIQFKSIFPDEGGNLNLLPAAIGPRIEWEEWIGPVRSPQGQGISCRDDAGGNPKAHCSIPQVQVIPLWTRKTGGAVILRVVRELSAMHIRGKAS